MVSVTTPRVTEYRTGPEPGGICICIKCGKPIEPLQAWMKEWAPGGDYAVGVHVSCAAQPWAHTCNLCGYGTDNKLTAIQHLDAAHRFTAPAAVTVVLK